MGVNIDDAIDAAKKMMANAKEEELENPQKETFKSTYKFWADRIKHFESLRREVEIRRGRKMAPINWKELAEHYKK